MTDKEQKIDGIIEKFEDKLDEINDAQIQGADLISVQQYKIRQQFKQSLYNRMKEIMPKKLEMPDIELLRNNRYYKLHQTRNEAITECIEAIKKELVIIIKNKKCKK